jgi:hypothetical protein
LNKNALIYHQCRFLIGSRTTTFRPIDHPMGDNACGRQAEPNDILECFKTFAAFGASNAFFSLCFGSFFFDDAERRH